MNKSSLSTPISIPGKSKQQHYAFRNDNKPDGKYQVYEIWEDGHPDQVIAGQKVQDPDERTLAPEQLDKMISFWRKLAADKKLKKPIITIQGDLGMGSEIMYGYEDGREGIPPNAKFHTIKPVFDKNISVLMHFDNQGKSLVYHSHLNSSTLQEELSNFNKLLTRFYNGEFSELLAKYSDRGIGWEHRSELTVENAKLRNNKQ